MAIPVDKVACRDKDVGRFGKRPMQQVEGHANRKVVPGGYAYRADFLAGEVVRPPAVEIIEFFIVEDAGAQPSCLRGHLLSFGAHEFRLRRLSNAARSRAISASDSCR